MPKIIATGGGTDSDLKQNPLKAFWEKFSSLDKFSKTLVVTTVLFLTFAGAITTITLSTRSSAGGGGIARVDIHPGIVFMLKGQTQALSTLAFDGNGSPVNSGVVYEWSMSSASSAARLSLINGQITELTALEVGCAQLTVIARDGLQTITKSTQVVVSDNSSVLPSCASITPTPVATISATITPTSTLSTTPTPTSTPVPTTSTLSPIADAYVRSDINKNYGKETTLRADKSPKFNSYLKFDLKSTAGRKITNATLTMRVINSNAAASNGTQSIKSVSNSSWSETSITYKNAPAIGQSISAVKKAFKNSLVYFDVTSWVKANQGKLATLGLQTDSADNVIFYSRENSNNLNWPTLNIYFQSTPTPTPNYSPTRTPTPTYYPSPTKTGTPTPTPH
ncbi:MAG: hypothetical protein A2798_00045 [Candidatus Levybacteria bacterium RIFCSPHIGHO2_01_FULL_37_17]|nr:MAG: hypothetical protein A2798_00045 [Candidatus Levybacteria bacterium RIFCSPHIGHO2_01_FULL_37_17]OGH36514.1 MAG: hypothetical protein A2959_03320 [Candidatus Levybacteria bacterium RIFCSPLOWO2_01_FULL_38_23]